MSTFFWSDTHFGHNLREMRPQYKSVEEMDDALIAAWNSVVTDEDDIWFLGDFAFGDSDRRCAIYHKLRGTKLLVVGNHDEYTGTLGALHLPWRHVAHGFIELDKADGRRLRPSIVLCHYPMEAWPGQDEGAVHLHGHSHGHARKLSRRFDIGADVEPRPLSLDEIVERVRGAGVGAKEAYKRKRVEA